MGGARSLMENELPRRQVTSAWGRVEMKVSSPVDRKKEVPCNMDETLLDSSFTPVIMGSTANGFYGTITGAKGNPNYRQS